MTEQERLESRNSGKAWLWFGGKDGWQVTSFHPAKDPAIGFPRNGDTRLFINSKAYDEVSNDLKMCREIGIEQQRAVNDKQFKQKEILKNALEKIMEEVGTSTLAYKIATEALQKSVL